MAENQEQAARLVTLAILGATVLYAVLGVAFVRGGVIPPEGLGELGGMGPVFGVVFLIAGAVSTGASFYIRRLVETRNPDTRTGGAAFHGAIIGMAMAEAAGALGLIHVLLTGSLLFGFLLWGLGIAGGVLHLPGFGASVKS